MAMKTSMALFKIAAAGAFLLAVVAVAVVVAPTVRGQTVRDRPLVRLDTHIWGGSQIGVELRDVDAADVRREQLPAESGAVVTEVRSGSAAAAAGFKAGDVVVTFDGERVRSARQLARLIEDTPDGRQIEVAVVRAGAHVALSVAPDAAEPFAPLRELRDFSFHYPEGQFVMPERFGGLDSMFRFGPGGRGRLGVTVQELSGQLGEYFGATAGVLVTAVDDDTPASQAGIKAGDVITRVGGMAVRTAPELQRRLADADGEVEIVIVREKKEQTIRATVRRDERVQREARRIVR